MRDTVFLPHGIELTNVCQYVSSMLDTDWIINYQNNKVTYRRLKTIVDFLKLAELGVMPWLQIK